MGPFSRSRITVGRQPLDQQKCVAATTVIGTRMFNHSTGGERTSDPRPATVVTSSQSQNLRQSAVKALRQDGQAGLTDD